MNVEEKAKEMNGRSRMCRKCRYGMACPAEVLEVCSRAFVDGFKKGWREHAYQSKRKAKRHHECVESGQDGQ
jgi:hypothetical protein